MKKLLIILLCAVMIVSCFCMTACGDKGDKKDNGDDTAAVSDETKEKGPTETVYNPFKEIGKVEPVDISNIAKAQGGDVVGRWVSAQALSYNVDPSLPEGEQTILDYSIIFEFKEDGTLNYWISLIIEEPKVATYTTDGGNIVFDGYALSIPNATYTVDGDVLLLNSDTLNCVFRRVAD